MAISAAVGSLTETVVSVAYTAPMPASAQTTSRRCDQLLELAYGYALDHGVADLSLRPLAAAVGSRPRVLLFLSGSKAGLVQVLLARVREEELALLEHARAGG